MDFITHLFCWVDAALREVPRHVQAKLAPSELVTLALLYALKGQGSRAFWRWLTHAYRPLFPHLPDRTRLLRLCVTHQAWADRFLADATLLGVADTFGSELCHPRWEGRSSAQLGSKGLSNHRWIVGVKFAYVVQAQGLIVDGDRASATVPDHTFTEFGAGRWGSTPTAASTAKRASRRTWSCVNGAAASSAW